MNLAVIPARGGSKRIPRKNIKEFCGKPMIAWSIAAAKASGLFDRIIVSTDDEEIAEVAQNYGAMVPFVRPKRLAGDHTSTVPVIAHAIKWYESQGVIHDRVCCIFATAPFIRASDIQSGLDIIQEKGCDYVFSITRYEFPIQRAVRVNKDGRVEMFQPKNYDVRSQDLEEAYHDGGQFYWGVASSWLAGKPIFSQDSFPVILPHHRVQDIDTPEDWYRAELMFQAMGFLDETI